MNRLAAILNINLNAGIVPGPLARFAKCREGGGGGGGRKKDTEAVFPFGAWGFPLDWSTNFELFRYLIVLGEKMKSILLKTHAL